MEFFATFASRLALSSGGMQFGPQSCRKNNHLKAPLWRSENGPGESEKFEMKQTIFNVPEWCSLYSPVLLKILARPGGVHYAPETKLGSLYVLH